MRNRTLFAALTTLLLTLSVAEARHRGFDLETHATAGGWLAELDGRGAEAVTAVVPSGDGGAYLVGNLVRRGEPRGFVARVDRDGQLRWKDVVRGADGMRLQQATFDPVRGRLLVAGVESKRARRGRRRGPVQQLVVAAYSLRGQRLWQRSVDRGSFSRSLVTVDVAADKRGNLYVVGETTGHFAGARARGHGRDIFLAKFDRRGRTLWTRLLGAEDRRWGGRANDTVSALAIPPAGGLVHVTGVAAGDLVSGRERRVARRFEMKVHPTGRIVDVQYGSAKSPVVDLAFDDRGNKYVLSNTPGHSGRRTVLTRFDRRGALRWSQTVGGKDANARLVVDGRRIYVARKARRGGVALVTFNRRGERLGRERLTRSSGGGLALAASGGTVFVAAQAEVVATRTPRGARWLPVPQETAGYRPDAPPPVRDARRGRGRGPRG